MSNVVHIHCQSTYCLFTCYKPWKGAEQWRWGAWGGGASKPLCFGWHAGAQLRSLVVGKIPYSHWKNDFALGPLNQIFYHNNTLLFLNNKQLLLHIMTWVSWVWNEIPSRIIELYQTNTQFVKLILCNHTVSLESLEGTHSCRVTSCILRAAAVSFQSFSTM